MTHNDLVKVKEHARVTKSQKWFTDLIVSDDGSVTVSSMFNVSGLICS